MRALHLYLNFVYCCSSRALTGNAVTFWIKVYHRDIVTAAFSHLWYPFGKKKKKNQFANGAVLEELRKWKKIWCPDTTFWIFFDFFFFLAISEIANNRCLNSSQVKIPIDFKRSWIGS